jgi:surface antigen
MVADSVAMHSPYLSRRTGLVSTLVLGVAAALLPPMTPASGAISTQCSGYQRCAQQGKSSAGYARANGRSYWRMYAGHNCTNYVAYRLVRKGMANRRPWSGPGNATHWGREMHRRTDNRPRVGSVAWWKAGSGPGGSSGHVAYVEKVISPSTILVSQDSWSGDFSWARVTKTSGWPSGFIHLKDTPLRNLTKPRLSGLPRVGTRLVASGGSWKPRPSRLKYRWHVGGRRVEGATTRSLRLDRHMIGKQVQVSTVATRFGYPRTVVASRKTRTVAPGRFEMERRPALSGRTRVSEKLRVTAGRWSPRPKHITFRWLADGKPVRRARSTTLRLHPRFARQRIAVAVTVRRPGYAPSTRILRTRTKVALGRLQMSSPPRLKGTPRRGETLRVRRGQTSPRADVRRVQWIRDGRRIKGANGRTYRLRKRDVGNRIKARVSYRHDGYRTRVLVTEASRRVRRR